jgi:(E)-4-hydroxy-3-methylbut-2-enyl-diphosphate synthase
MIKRRKAKKVFVGKIAVGGNAPISVQSMAKTDTKNIEATVRQIKRLEKAGCEIVRVAVLDKEASSKLKEIKRRINIPLVADIHFDYRLALSSIEAGADKLRINPGNIGAIWKVKEIVRAAYARKIPIRIGVNSGSLPKDLLSKYGKVTPEAMVEAALRQVRILEKLSYEEIVISLKATDIPTTIDSYKLISKKVNYPLHLGITEAGTLKIGATKSAVGIGSLLSLGIGDTLRVSLTADPVEEVKLGWEILKSLNLREYGPTLISCPTCGRCEIDMLTLVKAVEKKLDKIQIPLKVAVMGCVVNGPGEAKEADIGMAGGRGLGLIFKEGKIIAKVKERNLLKALFTEIDSILKEGKEYVS